MTQDPKIEAVQVALGDLAADCLVTTYGERVNGPTGLVSVIAPLAASKRVASALTRAAGLAVGRQGNRAFIVAVDLGRTGGVL